MDRDSASAAAISSAKEKIAAAAQNVKGANELVGSAAYALVGVVKRLSDLELDKSVLATAIGNALLDQVSRAVEECKKIKSKKSIPSRERKAIFIGGEISLVRLAWGNDRLAPKQSWQQVHVAFTPLVEAYAPDMLPEWQALVTKGLSHSR